MAKKLAQIFLALLTLFFLSPGVTLAQTPNFEFLSKPIDIAFDSAVSGNMAYVAAQEHIYILDISNPASPIIVGNYFEPGCVFSTIDIEGDSSYSGQAHFSCSPRNSIYIFDVSNPESIGFQEPIVLPSQAAFYEMIVYDGYLYISGGLYGLYILDVHNPSPLIEPTVYKPDPYVFIVDVKVRGNIAYIADNNSKVWTIDVSDKRNPQPLDYLDLPTSATGVSLKGDYAFVSLQAYLPGGNGGLQVVNIANPNDISPVGPTVPLPTPEASWDVEVAGNYAFMNDDRGKLFAIDISNPADPRFVAQYQMENEWRLTISGDLILASNAPAGLSIFRFSGLAPSAPTPFLDLPWDIGHLTFERAALNPTSWFDHHYPLQNYLCCTGPVTNYTGEIINEPYRSHNGYDYGQFVSVFLNTPVKAAAPGWAIFVSESHSGGAGNVIKIDHENGYQTWYEHLQPGSSLVIQTEGQRVYVDRGQTIGLTGMTGNATGPHIHFSVFKDRDGDGFEDESPFGVTDPLGWEGSFADPWPTDMGGAFSFNLFIARALPQSTQIPSSGGSSTYGDVAVTSPYGASAVPFSLNIANGPFERISNIIRGILPSFFLNAINNLGEQISQFLLPIQFSYDYSDADLSNIEESSLQFYTLNTQTGNWDSIQTTLDLDNNIAYGETLHFSQFALMGTVKDIIPPNTQVSISGSKGLKGWYKSDVKVEFSARDNKGGIGLQYILYSLDGSEWLEYKEPLNFSDEGSYSIKYQAFDKAENTEGQKTLELNIDKTPPLVTISATPTILWPPDGSMVPVIFNGDVSDINLDSTLFVVKDEYHLVEPKIGGFGQTILLLALRDESDTDGRRYTISVMAEDRAGNRTQENTEVIVPFDLR